MCNFYRHKGDEGCAYYWPTGEVKMKLTPWYPANIKPVREGWYEVRCKFKNVCGGMHYWNGKSWGETFAAPWRGVRK
jgi:hypothetical protein